MIVLFVPAFAGTKAFVRSNRAYLQSEAARWRQTGATDLASGRADAAVDAYRTALARGGDDPGVRLQLAQALIAAGHPAEAESHLRTLWADTPGDGPVNLALARLALQSGRTTDAVRYFHAAIDGAWEQTPQLSRRNARFELVRMLLQQDRQTEARSELIVLSDGVRDDPGQTLTVARLLVQAGDPRTALTLARRAIMLEPTNVAALTMAADLLFQDADYVNARDLLQRAGRQGPLAPDAQSELRDTYAALALDPLAPRLGPITRLVRFRRVMTIVRQRLDACAMSAAAKSITDLPTLANRVATAEHAAKTSRRAGTDDLEDAMAIAASVEQLPDTSCGPSSSDDRALRLVVRAHPPS
jgi:predicted Zn-dependent protease